jgi:hypothetical protein
LYGDPDKDPFSGGRQMNCHFNTPFIDENGQFLDLKNSFNIYDDRNNKILHVDAEELAEFQFDFFLPQLNVILGKRNFKLDVKTADNYETSSEVFLNGEKILLYTKDELEKGDFWDRASRTFFKKLNELLIKQNLKESFFLLDM